MRYRIKGKFSKTERKLIHQMMDAIAPIWCYDLGWTIHRARCDRRRCYATTPLSVLVVWADDAFSLAAQLPVRACELDARLRKALAARSLSGNVSR